MPEKDPLPDFFGSGDPARSLRAEARASAQNANDREMIPMNRLVVRYLESVQADGLVNLELGCGCGLDMLAPFDCALAPCFPARRWLCSHCGEYRFTELANRGYVPVCDGCGRPMQPDPVEASNAEMETRD